MDYAAENSTTAVVNLLKSFATVPAPVTSLSVKVNVPAVFVKMELPPLAMQHPLFDYRSAEIVYKKASFLATSTTKTVPLEAYLKNRENTTVTVKMSDLAEGTTYQMKVRLMNANGMGAWSRVLEFKVENSSDDESEEEKQARKAKKQEKEKSRKAKTQDMETKASGEKKKKKKKRSSQETEKRKKEESESQESEQSSEEETKTSRQTTAKTESQPEEPVPKPHASVPEPEPETSVPDPTPQPVPSEVAPQANSEPQAATPESLRHRIVRGDVEALEKVDASVLSAFVSPDGLPALHLCLLECRDMRRLQATIQCLLKKGCSLQQEVTCVAVFVLLHS